MNADITEKIIAALFLIVGIINFAPVLGLLSAAKLEAAYGIPATEPNLLILLKHRALLFGLLGGVILYAAFTPTLQPIAFILGFVSMLGFIAIAWQVGDANAMLRKIATIDLVACGLLLIALVLRFMLGKD